MCEFVFNARPNDERKKTAHIVFCFPLCIGTIVFVSGFSVVAAAFFSFVRHLAEREFNSRARCNEKKTLNYQLLKPTDEHTHRKREKDKTYVFEAKFNIASD